MSRWLICTNNLLFLEGMPEDSEATIWLSVRISVSVRFACEEPVGIPSGYNEPHGVAVNIRQVNGDA